VRRGAHFIDGAAASFSGEPELAVVSPYRGEPLGTIPCGGEAAVGQAVGAAACALRRWRATPLARRIGCLEALARRIAEERERLALRLVEEAGKTIRNARLELENVLAALRYFGEEAPRRLPGFDLPGEEGFTPRVVRDPVGVVAAIVPTNFPLQLLSWKLAPAVLAGCTVVGKPDPRTPFATLRLAELALEAGFPPGVVNVVQGPVETGARLVRHPGVAKVAFTGSVRAGRDVYQAAAQRIKRVTLELGGCSPLVVWVDADLKRWMGAVLQRSFYNSGQYCFRINRALVHARRYDEFLEELVGAASRLVVGDPADERTDLGPLIDRAARERVAGRIADAERRGARVCLDGRRIASPAGTLIGPSVLADVPSGAQVLEEETFGPVVAARAVGDLEEAIALANGTPYGLAAFALTEDPGTGARLAEELEAGTVWINALDRSSLELPFGGVKQSGIGVEKSRYAFDEYLQPRALYLGLRLGEGPSPPAAGAE
jgi:succinate-semialdehyde dehydrogenase/glutarate-semialdehyde dehydrogenase